MILIPLSVEKCLFSYWFDATALPSELTKLPYLLKIKERIILILYHETAHEYTSAKTHISRLSPEERSQSVSIPTEGNRKAL
jgi:hypothetical protein